MRFLALGERRASLDLRFGRIERRYLTVAALFELAVAPVLILVQWEDRWGLPPPDTFLGAVLPFLQAAALFGGLIGLLAVVRFSLVFPAIAVEDDSVDLRASWRLLGRGFGRLLGAMLLVGVPSFWLASIPADGEFSVQGQSWLSYSLAYVAIDYLTAAAVSVVLIIAYRTFAGSAPTTSPSQPKGPLVPVASA